MKQKGSSRQQHRRTRKQLFADVGGTMLYSLGIGTALYLYGSGAAAQTANTQDDAPQVTDTVVIKGKAQKDIDKAKARIEKIQGTASVVNSADVERGRSSNAEDLLAYQPGVYASATSGNGTNKISIRGSGLNAFYQGYSLGLRYLYDGLPITGPGGTQEDFLNAAAVNYTEILNGGNAFTYGALSLGGAINFVTHTGRSSPGNFASVEVGSYGFKKYQLSTGGVSKSGDTDYYLSVGRDQRTGYQVFTPNSGNDLNINIGQRLTDNLDTRFILRYRREQLMNGSTLTLGQINADPTQSRLVAGRYKKGSTLLESKTNYVIDNQSRFEFGLAYNNYPLDNGWIYSTTPQNWSSTDLSLSARYLRTGDKLFGKLSDTTIALLDTRQIKGDVYGYTLGSGGQRVFSTHTDYTGSQDLTLSANNDLHLDDKTTLSAGLAYVQIDRNVVVDNTTLANNATTNPNGFPSAVRYKDRGLAPRLGLSYEATPEVTLFGNVSRSVDPPVTWQMGSTSNAYVRPLKPQTGNTIEAGFRFKGDANEGSLSLYRTYVSNELLIVTITPATQTALAVTANSNATRTIHQGIEAGLTSRLWRGDDGDKVILRQAYTVNDFYYRNDPQFGSNRLPSLPLQVYQGELQYQQPAGFYASVNMRAMSGYYVDYANSLRAPGVSIFGAKFGYESDKGWKAFVDLRNLANKHYAVAANTAYDLKGVDSANFYPGDGFSVYSGVSFRF